MDRKEYPRKLTILLDRELEAKLAVERTCASMASGRPASQSATVVSILRGALASTPPASVMSLLDEATAAPLPLGRAAVVYLPGAQPIIISPDTAHDFASLVFPDLQAADVRIVAQKLLDLAGPYLGPPPTPAAA